MPPTLFYSSKTLIAAQSVHLTPCSWPSRIPEQMPPQRMAGACVQCLGREIQFRPHSYALRKCYDLLKRQREAQRGQANCTR